MEPSAEAATLSPMAATGPPTRDRLLAAALRLFATKGYAETSVGEIEAAAGLAPRRGTLYHYFPNKAALLVAAVEAQAAELDQLNELVQLLPLGDLRADLTLLARWTLLQLDTHRDLHRLLQREADRFPELLTAVRERLVWPAHHHAIALTRVLLGPYGLLDEEAPGVATIALGALLSYRTDQWMFTTAPGGIDDDQLIEAWVSVWCRMADSLARERVERHSDHDSDHDSPA